MNLATRRLAALASRRLPIGPGPLTTPNMSAEDKGTTAPKRVESDVYDRQIRLWGADAQVSVPNWFIFQDLVLITNTCMFRHSR